MAEARPSGSVTITRRRSSGPACEARQKEWDQQGRSDDLLWRGEAAAEARRWLERFDAGETDEAGPAAPVSGVALGARDEAYLRSVALLATRVRRRRRQLAIALVAFLATFAVVVSLLAAQVGSEATKARNEAARANAQEAAASAQADRARAEATRARDTSRLATAREHVADPTLVLALVREVESSDPTRRWAELARWALYPGRGALGARPPGCGQLRGVQPRWHSHRHRLTRLDRADMERRWRRGSPLSFAVTMRSCYQRRSAPMALASLPPSWDRTARIWNADGTGQPVVLRGHEAGLTSVAFSPDGTRIVTASVDGTARIWHANGTGQSLVLRGHQKAVRSAAFSPDGTRIVTASRDGTARVWNADGTGQPLVLRGHQKELSSAAYSPDGARIVTASWDGDRADMERRRHGAVSRPSSLQGSLVVSVVQPGWHSHCHRLGRQDCADMERRWIRLPRRPSRT